MINKVKVLVNNHLGGLLCSYSQIFFSNNKVFGALLMLVTFFDVGAGLAGMTAVFLVQITAVLFNFNTLLIKDGTYSYNSLMVGLALGVFYDFNLSFLLILIVISLLTFFLTLWFMNALGRKGLPFLSIPFLIGIWIIILGAGNFSALDLNRKELFSLAQWMPELFQGVTNQIALLPYSNVIYLYLRSVGAILFQFSDLAGIIIVIGIIYYSRIAFVLSLFGFSIGYIFYYYLEGDFSQLIYSYIGFNFILTAIALGGFFVVPSRRSFIQLIFTIPIIAVLLSALHTLFSYFGLPLYSLPFNIVVLLFISAMLLRTKTSGLSLVTIQHYSPEKHHYNYYSNVERFKHDTYVHIGLPIIGDWHISQGYEGEITHKGEWQHALDFDVRDDDGSSYRIPGYEKEDFYCFDLPILAPASGTIVKVVDDVFDNEVGKVNLEDNWGNTIIIKHAEYLYSKLSHIKKGTVKVKEGDVVKKGEVLAKCGSSGRSPEPHLHFQMQTTPYIGSKTLHHPISYYISKKNGRSKFHTFDVPEEGATVCNLKTTRVLTDTFGFIPGKKFDVSETGNENKETWEVHTTPANETYIWCSETNAIAWFVNNNNVFYFTAFKGDKNSLLYQFYLGAYKVPLGYYEDLELQDNMNIMSVVNPLFRVIHDFTAPFFHYITAKYKFRFTETDNEHEPYRIIFNTEHTVSFFGSKKEVTNYQFEVWDNKLKFTLTKNNKQQTILCEPQS
jgi:urea transporter